MMLICCGWIVRGKNSTNKTHIVCHMTITTIQLFYIPTNILIIIDKDIKIRGIFFYSVGFASSCFPSLIFFAIKRALYEINYTLSFLFFYGNSFSSIISYFRNYII